MQGDETMKRGTVGFAMVVALAFASAPHVEASIVAWGANDRDQLNVPSGTFTAISAGGTFNMALEATLIPEPSTLIIWSLLGALGIAVAWCRFGTGRRRPA
jgi:hypothetical protein